MSRMGRSVIIQGLKAEPGFFSPLPRIFLPGSLREKLLASSLGVSTPAWVKLQAASACRSCSRITLLAQAPEQPLQGSGCPSSRPGFSSCLPREKSPSPFLVFKVPSPGRLSLLTRKGFSQIPGSPTVMFICFVDYSFLFQKMNKFIVYRI